MYNNTKIFRDPIYGYVEIPGEIVQKIIDSAAFQRLRRIIQTTYSPLYASALHNRFVHSLGVYHLGVIAGNQLLNEIGEKFSDASWADRYKDLFTYACLLHDVGHAPFSHTGEKFYLCPSGSSDELHRDLVGKVNSNTFEKDVMEIVSSKSAAPHEILSVIVAIEQYQEFFSNTDEKEFFARCITGYKYKSRCRDAKLKNCFISLLNSSIIDVDKLDYLIRDAYTTGFNTVSIDYERLLTSITLAEDEDDYHIAYTKRALSVIENVVYARDSEKKWIQTHPVVVYESYLLENAMYLIEEMSRRSGSKFFSKDSISPQKDGCGVPSSVNLLCDDDVVCLMKTLNNKLIDEFFDRSLRRHPIWKSEAEYRNVCLQYVKDGELKDNFETAMAHTVEYLKTKNGYSIINEQTIQDLRKDIDGIETLPDGETKKAQKRAKHMILSIMEALQRFAANNNMEYDFVILKASQFNSGFGNEDFANLNIVIDSSKKEQKVKKFGDIMSSLRPDKTADPHFFYIYYRRSASNKDIENSKYTVRDELFKALIGLPAE